MKNAVLSYHRLRSWAPRADRSRRQTLERIAGGRWGMPQDLAGVVILLASATSDHVQVTSWWWMAAGWLAEIDGETGSQGSVQCSCVTASYTAKPTPATTTAPSAMTA